MTKANNQTNIEFKLYVKKNGLELHLEEVVKTPAQGGYVLTNRVKIDSKRFGFLTDIDKYFGHTFDEIIKREAKKMRDQYVATQKYLAANPATEKSLSLLENELNAENAFTLSPETEGGSND